MIEFDVEVTLQDIKSGQEGVFDCCPVALALRKLGCDKIDVDEDRILLTHNNKRLVFKTPRTANLFIDDYDSSREVKPINFKLEKPQLATIKDERMPLFKSSKWAEPQGKGEDDDTK